MNRTSWIPYSAPESEAKGDPIHTKPQRWTHGRFWLRENPHRHAHLQHLVVRPIRGPFWVRYIDNPLKILAKLHCACAVLRVLLCFWWFWGTVRSVCTRVLEIEGVSSQLRGTFRDTFLQYILRTLHLRFCNTKSYAGFRGTYSRRIPGSVRVVQ